MDTLRNYAFWFALGLVAVLLLLSYLVVVAPQAGEAAKYREELDKSRQTLDTFWAKKNSMKNSKWIAAAGQRLKELEKEKSLCGDLLAKMAIDAPLSRIKSEVRYKEDYNKEVKSVRDRARRGMTVKDNAFDFREFGMGKPEADEMVPLAKEIVIQSALVDALLKSGVRVLSTVRFGSPTNTPGSHRSHPVARVQGLYDEYKIWLDVVIPYKNADQLMRNMLDSPCRFLVRQFKVTASGEQQESGSESPSRPRSYPGAGFPGPEGTLYPSPPAPGGEQPVEPVPSKREGEEQGPKQGESLVEVSLELAACDFSAAPSTPGPAAKKANE